jgi:Tol biopolymer transport system component
MQHRAVVTSIVLIGGVLGCGSASEGPTTPEEAARLVPALEAVSFQLVGAGKVAFERIGANGASSAIYVIDGSTASSAHAFDNQVVHGAALSPDGRRFAYTTFTDLTTAYDVYVANVDGTGAQQVTRFAQQEGAPTWTPDGARIVVAAGGVGAVVYNIYSQSPIANPGDQTQLTNFSTTSGTCPTMLGSGDFRVATSPQGRMAFACSVGEIDVSTNGTFTASYLPTRPDRRRWTNVYSPAWSPDGALIAFIETTSDSATNYSLLGVAVKVMNGDGSNVATLANVPTAPGSNAIAGGGWAGLNNISLCWMPDGSRLVFNVPESQQVGHLWVVRADGTGLSQLTTGPGAWDRSVSCSR